MNLDKKYQIFISSTIGDLQSERYKIIETVLQMGHIPIVMEAFNSSTDHKWDAIKRALDSSDYYVVVQASNYGEFTEKEYDYAYKQGIPTLAFIQNDIVSDGTEKNGEKFQGFRRKLMNEPVIRFWNNAYDLCTNLSISLRAEFIRNPRAGWVHSTKNTLLNELTQEKEHRNIIDNWGLSYIFRSRAEKNADSDYKFATEQIRQLDCIAFGLRSFRENHTPDVRKCLCDEMRARFLVMNPNGEFIKQREIEENETVGKMSKSINDLVEWGRKLKRETNGNIAIKFYNSMTLDFYWRMDDTLYVGPYLYGRNSQQTLTQKFQKNLGENQGNLGFQTYTDYFESLWNDPSLTESII